MKISPRDEKMFSTDLLKKLCFIGTKIVLIDYGDRIKHKFQNHFPHSIIESKTSLTQEEIELTEADIIVDGLNSANTRIALNQNDFTGILVQFHSPKITSSDNIGVINPDGIANHFLETTQNNELAHPESVQKYFHQWLIAS